MKKEKLFILAGSISLTIILVVTSLLTACAKPTPAQSIELKAITYGAKDNPGLDGFWKFVDEVNQRAKGELTIKVVGGPEVVPQYEQGAAVARGVYDMVSQPLGFSKEIAQATESALKVSRLKPAEERKAGFYDAINATLEKQKLRFMGRMNYLTGFYIYTKAPVAKYEDLLKLKIRCSQGTLTIVKGLGAVPVVLAGEEVYSALERGVVDGVITTQDGYKAQSLQELAKYVITHRIESNDSSLLMNLDSWNRLPKHLQKLLQDVIVDIEPWIGEHFSAKEEAVMKEALAAGIKPVTFAPADAERYLVNAVNSEWERLQTVNPELYLLYKKVLSEK